MKIVRVNKGKTIPLPFRFISALLIGLSVVQVLRNLQEPWSIIIAILLSFILPGIWFASNIIIIDLERKTLFDGSWTMGFRFGKNHRFESIDSFFINKVKIKQTIYSLANQQNILVNHEYKAYVKLQSGEKYFLFSHPLEERAQEKLTKIRKKLGLPEG